MICIHIAKKKFAWKHYSCYSVNLTKARSTIAKLMISILYSCTCRWYVNWGDGSSSYGYQPHLGPFQVAHQYPQYCKQYGITVYYCSAPGGCPYRRCCDSIYRVIDVSYDPQNPHPDVKFEQF